MITSYYASFASVSSYDRLSRAALLHSCFLSVSPKAWLQNRFNFEGLFGHSKVNTKEMSPPLLTPNSCSVPDRQDIIHRLQTDALSPSRFVYKYLISLLRSAKLTSHSAKPPPYVPNMSNAYSLDVAAEPPDRLEQLFLQISSPLEKLTVFPKLALDI